MRKQGINGDLITEYREKNMLTQAKFASRLNKKLSESGVDGTYSDKAISMWENGNRQPADINVLKALAKTIGVSLDELCFMNENNESCSNNSCCQNDDDDEDACQRFVETIYKFRNENEDRLKECIEISMYKSAMMVESNWSDSNPNETKEFWLPVPFEPLEMGDVTWAWYYWWDGAYEWFEEHTKGAKQISEEEFKACVLNYLLNNAESLRKNYDENVAVDYVKYRFSEEAQKNFYESILFEQLSDLCGFDSNGVSVSVVGKYYTDKGMILRMRVDLRGEINSFIKLFACYPLLDDDKWREANQKSIDELLKAE